MLPGPDWWCREPCCPRRSFTEQIPHILARARLTAPLRTAVGRQVRDTGSTVLPAARDLRLSWPTVMDAFRVQAREVTAQPLPEVKVPGIDETQRGKTKWAQTAPARPRKRAPPPAEAGRGPLAGR
ncbi:transposase family protein [Streptomyces sp. NPDC057617]|uniref:transposase family protein n=1 Tax=Streptomyces sp. NPDC057617 TaxID=3346184 RepID=UPI0036BD80AE